MWTGFSLFGGCYEMWKKFGLGEACRPGGLRHGGRRNFLGEVTATGNHGILSHHETGKEGGLACWGPLVYNFSFCCRGGWTGKGP